MAGIVCDTSLYIQALRYGDEAILSLRRVARAGESETRPLYLSVGVLEELYVGASDAKSQKALSRYEREFETVGWLILPGKSDWVLVGRVLNKIGEKYGFDLVGRSRLTNDALIALSAASLGLTVITRNGADYALINEFRPISYEEI
jgi:predicted nucleic acid-binding protein